MEAKGRVISKHEAPGEGLFVGPHVLRIEGIEVMEREVFGPVLHVATFEAEALDRVIEAINAKGYGLTFGLHTRIEGRVQRIVDGVHAGNIYVNRNQIGAVVGAQPFGGEGLSGTGPKAGGPHYLRRFRRAARPAVSDALPPPESPQVNVETWPEAGLDRWSTRPDRVAILRKYLRGKGSAAIAQAAATDFGPLDLPGPTGEANTFSLVPRGRALCLGPDEETLLAQVIQALAAGNAVLAVAPGAVSALKMLIGKGLPIVALDGIVSADGLAKGRFDVAAFGGAEEPMCALRQALAAREGPIVPLITESLYPAAYAVERAVCVDTTAAGGNASLLAGL